MKAYLYIIFFIFLFSTPLLAQPPLPSPTGSIVLLSGGNVVFHFTSLNKYTNGITLTEWTRLAIKYDSDGGGTNWRLAVRSQQAQFDGDGGNSMDLDVLELTPVDGGGNNALGAFLQPTIQLSGIDQDLVQGATPDGTALDDNLVNITYECGVTNSVMEFQPDYYNIDLEITLYED